MVDIFTRDGVCPISIAYSEREQRAAIIKFFSGFGYPYKLFKDQVRNFESEPLWKLCETLWIYKTQTTPYKPSANGQVEHYYGTLIDAVPCYIDDCPKSLDQYLGPLAVTLRSAIKSNTGFTAHKYLLGREVNVPATILNRPLDPMIFKIGMKEKFINMQFARKFAKSSWNCQEKVKGRIKTKRHYDIRAREYQFKSRWCCVLAPECREEGRVNVNWPCCHN